MKKICAISLLLLFLMGTVAVQAEEKKQPEIGDIIMIPLEVAGYAIAMPLKLLIFGACELNNAIYPHQKVSYYNATGEKNPLEPFVKE
ncbi:MAG: hypothetical protein P9M13_03275 [Candidatus Ancaeobacter aquaticus]|nr:hypothetical protein [Candidatus Ancaeobacter aquaticus]